MALSDFVNEMFNEIMKRHWTFLETEESILKLEYRKELEDLLKEYLSVVPYNLKFCLPETDRLFQSSIINLENFSVQKGINAFDSISQYANNLYTKPWRKEFRILKMYSGFYQHEIKTNLVDAEILFEEMGYKRINESVFILDGPICPDQIANVSRDAMTAYIELQIMKHISAGLHAIGIKWSWLEIYKYRKNNIGSPFQAIKNIAQSLDEKRNRSRQKLLFGDNYGYIDVQPSPNYFSSNSQFCPAHCQCNLNKQYYSISKPHLTAQSNCICCLSKNSSYKTNLVYSNLSYPQNYHYNDGMSSDKGGIQLPQMSHSRSLEHYTESHNHNTMLPHRHSFDQEQQLQQNECPAHRQYYNSKKPQQHQYYHHVNQPHQNLYETPYDCIDGNSLGGGSSTISYAAVANTGSRLASAAVDGDNSAIGSTYSHPYNVSGNRFPLPNNISHQLSTYDNMQCNNYNGDQDSRYAHVTEQNIYSTVTKLPQHFMKKTNVGGNIQDIQKHFLNDDSIQSDHLIHFDDVPAASRQQSDSLSAYHTISEPCDTLSSQYHCAPGRTPIINNDTYTYDIPNRREIRLQNTLNFQKNPYNSEYESANDDYGNISNPNQRNQSSPTQFKKNQDGVGSSEQWNYVYRKLEKDHSKDLAEKTVETIDMDSLNINDDTLPKKGNTTEKRRSYYLGNEDKTREQLQQEQEPQQKQQQQQHQHQQHQQEQQHQHQQKQPEVQKKGKIFETSKNHVENAVKYVNSTDNNKKKTKSDSKDIFTTSRNNTNNKTQNKIKDNKTMSNNNNDNLTHSSKRTNTKGKEIPASISNYTNKQSESAISSNSSFNAISTKINATQWSCTFCTFLNPDDKRICEMCYHTKDHRKMETSTNSKSTGGTTVAHNTPTCA